jgi:hypothetical protein
VGQEQVDVGHEAQGPVWGGAGQEDDVVGDRRRWGPSVHQGLRWQIGRVGFNGFSGCAVDADRQVIKVPGGRVGLGRSHQRQAPRSASGHGLDHPVDAVDQLGHLLLGRVGAAPSTLRLLATRAIMSGRGSGRHAGGPGGSDPRHLAWAWRAHAEGTRSTIVPAREEAISLMWMHPLTIALVAVGSSLLTMFLTPWLQQNLWRYQRRAEIRLAAIKEFNRLTTEYITGVLWDTTGTYQPPAAWFQALNMANADIEVLFSEGSKQAVKAVDVLIGPAQPGLGPQGKSNANDFITARDAALRALYSEVIPLRPGWWRF